MKKSLLVYEAVGAINLPALVRRAETPLVVKGLGMMIASVSVSPSISIADGGAMVDCVWKREKMLKEIETYDGAVETLVNVTSRALVGWRGSAAMKMSGGTTRGPSHRDPIHIASR